MGYLPTLVDRIGRYATSIHRQLLQDMTQLERVQRLRNGEAVQPPMIVDLNVHGFEESGFCAAKDDASRLIVTPSDHCKLLETASPVREVIGAQALGQRGTQAQADPKLEFCETNPRLETRGGDAAGDVPEDQGAQTSE